MTIDVTLREHIIVLLWKPLCMLNPLCSVYVLDSEIELCLFRICSSSSSKLKVFVRSVADLIK